MTGHCVTYNCDNCRCLFKWAARMSFPSVKTTLEHPHTASASTVLKKWLTWKRVSLQFEFLSCLHAKQSHALCCAVLCCAVLCCAVLCCSELCCVYLIMGLAVCYKGCESATQDHPILLQLISNSTKRPTYLLWMQYIILFYSILFYSILFYSILFYSILFYLLFNVIYSLCLSVSLNRRSLNERFKEDPWGRNDRDKRVQRKSQKIQSGKW